MYAENFIRKHIRFNIICLPIASLILVAIPKTVNSAIFNIANGDEAGLIAAINTANGNGVSDTINLAVGGTYTLTAVDNDTNGFGNNGLPVITTGITINGNGATIERQLTAAGVPCNTTDPPRFRFFEINDPGSLTLNDLTLQNGCSSTVSPGGGAILNWNGTLVINTSTLTNNSALPSTTGDGGAISMFGGCPEGICAAPSTTINYSTIESNLAVGLLGRGGGISNCPFANLPAGTIGAGNPPPCYGTTLIINGSTISNNQAYAEGGGIALLSSATSTSTNGGPNAQITDSTISGNITSIAGGGMICNGCETLDVINSTCSDNFASNVGGCLQVIGSGNNAENVRFFNSTITDNTVSLSCSTFNAGSGLNMQTGTVSTNNTIVALNNTGCDCAISGGALTSLGYNIDSDGTCFPAMGADDCSDFNDNNDKVNCSSAQLMLGPLQNNGGDTDTHALLEGSVAIDMGDPAGCDDPLNGTLTADQRGEPRPVDGDGNGSMICDIGAFEFQGVIEIEIDIKPRSDPNSINCLRNRTIAVAILTTSVGDGDSVDFDATTVDHTTVEFEGATEIHSNKWGVRRHEVDVDGDGDTDLLLHFKLFDTNLDCASTEGTLTGQTFGGDNIEGSDSVNMVD